MELCLQMAIIFVGKQFVLSVVEYHLPRIWKLLNTLRVMAGMKKEDKTTSPQWIQVLDLQMSSIQNPFSFLYFTGLPLG